MTLRASHLRQLNGNNSPTDAIELGRIVSKTDIDLLVFFICNSLFKIDKIVVHFVVHFVVQKKYHKNKLICQELL